MKLMNIIAWVIVSMCTGILIGFTAGKPNYTYKMTLYNNQYKVVGEAYTEKCITDDTFNTLPIVRDEYNDKPFRPIFAGMVKIKK